MDSSITSDGSERVRMVVESTRDSKSTKWVKEGSFVEDTVQKEFEVAGIRNTLVPEDVGSAVSLSESRHSKRDLDSDDDEDDDEENRITPEERRRRESVGVLFNKSDLENYDKYQRDSTSSSRKRTITYAVSTILAVCLTAGLGIVLMGKIQNSDGQSMATKGTDNWWSNSNIDADVQDPNTVSTFIEDDPDAGSPEYTHFQPPPSEGDSPDELSSLASVTEPIDYDRDISYLWMIPRTATLQVRDIIGHCYHHHFTRLYKGPDQGADTIFNHMPYKVANSMIPYYPQTRGRMFTMFRDPLLRTVDMWMAHREEEGNIGLEDYLRNHHDNNWMTRFLTNNFDRPLTEQDLDLAKTVVREKVIVGLDEFKRDSFNKFIHYFGWDALNQEVQQCVGVVMNAPGYEDLTIQYPQEFSPEYELLNSRNHMDAPLYEYAKQIYEEQDQTLFQDLV